MNSDIITRLVYDHMTIEPAVIQNLKKRTLFVSTDREDNGKICNTLQSIEIGLDHSVNINMMLPHPSRC